MAYLIVACLSKFANFVRECTSLRSHNTKTMIIPAVRM